MNVAPAAYIVLNSWLIKSLVRGAVPAATVLEASEAQAIERGITGMDAAYQMAADRQKDRASQFPLTDFDKKRITKEIEILSKKLSKSVSI